MTNTHENRTILLTLGRFDLVDRDEKHDLTTSDQSDQGIMETLSGYIGLGLVPAVHGTGLLRFALFSIYFGGLQASALSLHSKLLST